MHIISGINGLHAGATDHGSGIYNGLRTNTIQAASADLEPEVSGSDILIKTALPNIHIEIAAGFYDVATKKVLICRQPIF